MANRKKSAKDIAFEKERVKFRHEIREQQAEIVRQKILIQELQSKQKSLESVIAEKQDWIDRLLEYIFLFVLQVGYL